MARETGRLGGAGDGSSHRRLAEQEQRLADRVDALTERLEQRQVGRVRGREADARARRGGAADGGLSPSRMRATLPMSSDERVSWHRNHRRHRESAEGRTRAETKPGRSSGRRRRSWPT